MARKVISSNGASGPNGVSSLPVVVQEAGYRREAAPGGIVILRLTDSTPETIEAWFEDCNKLMESWKPQQRLRYLHDIRQAERVTPRGLDRVTRILHRMRLIPVGDSRGAILTRNATLAGLLGTFLKRRPRANWQIRFFQDEDKALHWLRQ
ncbi:MAG TPA: hypothetical protein VKQ72_01365, partial [Aggregatilineales bacterium]|nr:hypothetical protein [Aggregatilineales bacterium]